MRFIVRSLAPLVALALVACTGGDDDAPTPTAAPTEASVPVEQRYLTEADAPGTKPDPVETRETTEDLDEFMSDLAPHMFVDLNEDETTAVFQDAGFTWAAEDVRFFGETHKQTAPHVFGAIFELGSEDGAKSVLDVLEADSLKPCPESCATQISSFDVDDIPDGRGVHRLATAQLIKTAGTPNQHPFDSYWVGFTEGSIVYSVNVQGRPGSVSEEQARKIAGGYYERLAAA